MNIGVFGSGYVGLVVAGCLAEVGNTVVCVDIEEDRIRMLRAKEIPIYEPGLKQIVAETTERGLLSFTTNPREALREAEVVIVAVGTPPDGGGGADLSQVEAVARTIGDNISEPVVVMNKSTVPVGTAAIVRSNIQAGLDQRGVEVHFDVVSNPEFLKEGAAINDFRRPDRIIVGTENQESLDLIQRLYAPFSRNHEKMVAMDVTSAELTKYAANAMLATKISFMNEIAALAEQVGADVEQVRLGIGSDPRIGYSFIYPGAGYGGSCFPKDVLALQSTAKANGVEPRILDAVHDVNEAQKRVLGTKVRRFFGESLAGRCIAVWGLAFKPNTDDIRDAASLVLIEDLTSADASVRAYDPVAGDIARRHLGEGATIVVENQYDALEGADALVVVTEWKQFWSPDFDRIAELLKYPVIFYGRNVYELEPMVARGFSYHSVGRPVVGPATIDEIA